MGDTGTKPKRTFLVGPGPPTSQTRKNNKNTIVSAPLNPTVSSSAAAPAVVPLVADKEASSSSSSSSAIIAPTISVKPFVITGGPLTEITGVSETTSSSSTASVAFLTSEEFIGDEEYAKKADTNRLKELEEELKKCQEDCKALSEEYTKLKQIETLDSIKDIILSNDKKLIDLLIHRVLDPSPEWHSKIDILINIPTSLKGAGILRGGDYFEALFQLAIAINVLPQFYSKFIRFYDIKQYKTLGALKNYLYIKPIKNSGGGEQGISDITFEVSTNSEFNEIPSNDYSCGELPVPLSKTQTKNPYYFISVKGYKKEKSIKSEYDIPLLDQQINLPDFKDLNKNIIVQIAITYVFGKIFEMQTF